MVSESEMFMEIGRRRGKEPNFATADNPASSSDFEHLGEGIRVGAASDTLTALGRMRLNGFITCSNIDASDTTDDITLTEEGERRLASSLVVKGETMD